MHTACIQVVWVWPSACWPCIRRWKKNSGNWTKNWRRTRIDWTARNSRRPTSDMNLYSQLSMSDVRMWAPHLDLVCFVIGVLTRASAGVSCRHVSVRQSVRLSVTFRYSETAQLGLMPHDSSGIIVFWCRKSRQNSNGVTPNEASNAGGVGYMQLR